MTLPRPISFARLALLCAVTFVAALLAFRALSGSDPATPVLRQADLDVPTPGQASTPERIAALQRELRTDPDNVSALTLLGDADLQRVRETGDAGFYKRAAGAFARAPRFHQPPARPLPPRPAARPAPRGPPRGRGPARARPP